MGTPTPVLHLLNTPTLPLEDLDQPCERRTCRAPHYWTGGHCLGVRRPVTTSKPVGELAAAVRTQIGDAP